MGWVVFHQSLLSRHQPVIKEKRQQMSKNKKEEAPEVKEVIVEKAPKTSSKARAEFEALIERYKEQNPVKFALKEAELKKKLANL